MQKRFVVASKTLAKTTEFDEPWAAISVSTHAGDFAKLRETNRVGLLRLAFWDISTPPEQSLVIDPDTFTLINRFDNKLFTREQARQVLDFAKEHWDKVECFLVHCEAGRSRSPAIAAALEYIYHGREASMPYFKKFKLNHFVYKTILEEQFGSYSDEVKTTPEPHHLRLSG